MPTLPHARKKNLFVLVKNYAGIKTDSENCPMYGFQHEKKNVSAPDFEDHALQMLHRIVLLQCAALGVPLFTSIFFSFFTRFILILVCQSHKNY